MRVKCEAEKKYVEKEINDKTREIHDMQDKMLNYLHDLKRNYSEILQKREKRDGT